jgi:hypothetical protein
MPAVQVLRQAEIVVVRGYPSNRSVRSGILVLTSQQSANSSNDISSARLEEGNTPNVAILVGIISLVALALV